MILGSSEMLDETREVILPPHLILRNDQIFFFFSSVSLQGGLVYILLKGSAKIYLGIRHSARVQHRAVLNFVSHGD